MPSLTFRLEGFAPAVFEQALAAAQQRYQEWREQMLDQQLRLAQSVPDKLARLSLEVQILAHATYAEVQAVRDTLAAGQLGFSAIDCVIAVIARQRDMEYLDLTMRGIHAPFFERWLYQLPTSATPATNVVAALLDSWLAAWQEAHPVKPEPMPDPDLVLELAPRVRKYVVYAEYDARYVPRGWLTPVVNVADPWLRPGALAELATE